MAKATQKSANSRANAIAERRKKMLANRARVVKADEMRRNSKIGYLKDGNTLYFDFKLKESYLRKNRVPEGIPGKDGYVHCGEAKAEILPGGEIKATVFYPFERLNIYQDRLKRRGITPIFFQELRMAYEKETGKPLRRVIIAPEGPSPEDASAQGYGAYKSLGAERKGGELVVDLLPRKRMPHRR